MGQVVVGLQRVHRDVLATADAPLKDRLASAFHAHLVALTPQDLADGGLQIDFEDWLKNLLLGGS